MLERSSKGTALTPAGKLAVNSAQKIFAEIHNLKTSLNSFPYPAGSNLKGTIHIMYNNSIEYTSLISSSNEFLKSHPLCSFDFKQKPLQDLFKALFNKKADLGLFVAPIEYPLTSFVSKEQLKNLSIIPYSKDTLMVAVSKMSPLSKQKSLSLKTCLKYPIIHMQPDSEESEKDNWLAELLNQHGMPNFIMRVNNQDHIADVVAANIGIIIVSKRIIQSLPKSMFNDIAAIPLRPAIAVYGNYVLNNTVPPSPLLQAYLPYLLKKVSTKI